MTDGLLRRGRIAVVVGQAAARSHIIPHRQGEGGGVLGAFVGTEPRVHGAVAVQIPADGVELLQVADFNQAVVVAVVVNALGAELLRGVVAAVVQRRVLAGLETPGVGAGGTGFVGGVQGAPVGVDAGVAGGGGQLGGGLAHAVSRGAVGVADVFAAGVEIPVAVADTGIVKGVAAAAQSALAVQPADVPFGSGGGVDRAGGVAVVDDAPVLPHQSADIAAAAGYRGAGVAGAD